MLLDNIEIIVGTYEEFLLGYQVKHVDEVYQLVQTFASHGHRASIRCATSNGKMMASGGADEIINFYDMVLRKEAGVLMYHSGTVNCIAYSPDGSHLLSGGDDGVLAIHRVSNFILEKSFGSAHKGSAILDISVHPSGKLALTVGADATLRTWNLVKGRQAYATRLGSSKCGAAWQISGVCWSPNGTFYALGFGSKVDVYSVEKAAVVYSVAAESKTCSLCFLNDNLLTIGCESGVIYIHNVKKKCLIMEKKAHEQRVKCLGSVSSEDSTYIVSASSSGEIKLWEYKAKALRELSNVTTGCRITCLTLPTCGYPTNFKVEKTEELETDVFQTEGLEDYVHKESHVRFQPTRKEVLIVEEEVEVEKPQTKKKKKKQIDQSESSLFKEAEYEKPVKKKKKEKAHQHELSKLSKDKNTKGKKRRSSAVNSWKVSDVAS